MAVAESLIEKTNHTVETSDLWHLHLVHTRATLQASKSAQYQQRCYPVLLVPGLGSSGAYSFDLSPQGPSLVNWLAVRGWDVWVCELRGNGMSDKPSILAGRSRWWTIDDMVDLDIPPILGYVAMQSGCSKVHVMGHSMGGMLLTALLAKGGASAARMRSVTIIGSSCFLKGSWWGAIRPIMGAAALLYAVPAGATLRAYSNLAFTRFNIPAIDILYFYPRNTDPALARAILARNFSAISPGVILQMRTAFASVGLRSARGGHGAAGGQPYADAAGLKASTVPVFMITGDRDKMCPPQGARKQFELLGTHDKKLVVLGPESGQVTHYGHFDLLCGRHAEEEVFPQLLAWLEDHDAPDSEAQAVVDSKGESLSSATRAQTIESSRSSSGTSSTVNIQPTSQVQTHVGAADLGNDNSSTGASTSRQRQHLQEQQQLQVQHTSVIAAPGTPYGGAQSVRSRL